MVRIKEMFTPQRFITTLGALRFSQSIFKDEVMNPHTEMKYALEMYERRPMINSGVKQIVRFILGNELSVFSTDKRTAEFFETWLNQRRDLRTEIENFITTSVVTGNGYLEPQFRPQTNGALLFDTAFCIADPSRIYKFLDAADDEEYWLYEVPREVRFYMGQKPRFWKLNYVKGSYLFQQLVWAIPVHKDKIWHHKVGWSRDGIYGRGFLASAIDDSQILSEILKNMAIIARYRALGKKIISIGDENNVADPKDIAKLEEDLRALQDEDHLIINKPFKAEPLAYTGENDPMAPQLDFIQKDVTSGLVPNYLTNWNADSNRATAEQARIPFQLELDSMRTSFIEFLNTQIIGRLRNTYTWIAADTTFAFGNVNLESKQEQMTYATQMFTGNVISLNELRKVAGYERVEGGDVWAWQLQSPPVENIYKPDDMGGGLQRPSIPAPNTAPKQSTPTKATVSANSQSALKETAPTDDVRSFLQGLGSGNEIVRSKTVGGRSLRVVRSPQGFSVYEDEEKVAGTTDSREEADAALDKKATAIEQSFDDAPVRATTEDALVQKMFDEIAAAHAQAIEDIFKTLGKKKEAVTLSAGSLDSVQPAFEEFDRKMEDIIARYTKELTALAEKPGPHDKRKVAASAAVKAKLKATSELLMQSKTAQQIKTYSQQSAADIMRTLADGIAAGRPLGDIKQDLKDKYTNWKDKPNAQDYDIERIVRTELNGNSSLLKLKKWELMGFKKYRWITVGDARVRPDHKARHNHVYDISEALDGKEVFPGGSLNPDKPNINCRCTVALE